MIRAVLAAIIMICAAIPGHTQEPSTEELTQRTIERRAVEAVIWGMPAVNAELLFQAVADEAQPVQRDI